MTKYKLLCLILVLVSCLSSFAQDDSDYNSKKKIIIHKTKDYGRDKSKLWIDVTNFSDEDKYQKQLFFSWKIDKSKIRKSSSGSQFYKTNLIFGFKDQEEFYELPFDFYGETDTANFQHYLAYLNGDFYILAYDLYKPDRRNLVLFKLTKEKTLLNFTLAKNVQYANLYLVEHQEETYPFISYYDETNDKVEEYRINPTFVKANNILDAERSNPVPKTTDSGEKVFTHDYWIDYVIIYDGSKTAKEMVVKRYEKAHNPIYDPERYLIGKKIVLAQASVGKNFDKGDVAKLPINLLRNSENEGWRDFKDWYNRYTSSIFLQYKTNYSDLKTNSSGLKYYQTQIRFGFKDENYFYELPQTFYLNFDENVERRLFNEDAAEKQTVYFQPPALMFANGTFYVYLTNYIGNDIQEGTLFTYLPSQGITKDILFSNNIKDTRWGYYSYFAEDKEDGFALLHFDILKSNLLKTYRKENQWLTINHKLGVSSQREIGGLYRSVIKNLYLLPPPEPYQKVALDEKVYPNKSFNVLIHYSIFTNSEKDQKRLAELRALKEFTFSTDAEFLFSVPKSERAKYRQSFTEQDIDKRIGFEEIPYTRLQIPFMPQTKDQNPFDACVSYAYGALFKQYIDRDWQLAELRKKYPDALNKETDISYFGMQQYYRGNKYLIDEANIWRYDGIFSLKDLRYQAIKHYSSNIAQLTFDFVKEQKSSQPFEIVLQNEKNFDDIAGNVLEYFVRKAKENPSIGKMGVEVQEHFAYTNFKLYFEKLYEANKNANKTNNQLSKEINEIHEMTGIPVKHIDLEKALKMPNLYAFYYSLFFSKSPEHLRLRYTNSLNDLKMANTPSERKKQIIKILKQGFPVLISIHADMWTKKIPHSAIIEGYRKVRHPVSGQVYDLFKIKNSWGKVWDYQTNEGWFVADLIIESLKEDSDFIYISANKALPKEFIEYTDEYQKLFNGKFTERKVMEDRKIFLTKGVNQKDASVLVNMPKGLARKAIDEIYIKYFTDLGYKFIRIKDDVYTFGGKENVKKDAILEFDGIEVESWNFEKLPCYNVSISTANYIDMHKLLAKMDFSKIQGYFTQEIFSDSDRIYLRYEDDLNPLCKR